MDPRSKGNSSIDNSAMHKDLAVSEDPWRSLNKYTDARIGLGRAGVSLPTSHHLSFQRDHAAARDAVNRELDWPAIESALLAECETIFMLQSCVTHRAEYLQRPDLGRQLNANSVALLEQHASSPGINGSEVVIVITDGLSAPAIEQSAVLMVRDILSGLSRLDISCSAICCARYGRVAVGDHIASILNSKHCILLVGERPGLSSPNSLGVYYTYAATVTSTDANRNCISNIREGGQSIRAASGRLCWLIEQASKLGLSGVALKDDSEQEKRVDNVGKGNFLLPNSKANF